MNEQTKKHSWCTKHWEPYTRLHGGLTATSLLMQYFVDDPRVVEAIKPLRVTMSYAESMNQLAKQNGPICCFLGDEICQEVFLRIQVKDATSRRTSTLDVNN